MKSLAILYRTFLSRTAVISDCFLRAHGNHLSQYAQEMCVIKLYDLWERFCRELIFLSAYAEPMSISGNRISRIVGLRTRNDVLVRLRGIKTYSSRPVHLITWGDPTTSIDIAQNLGVSNFQNISLSLGATPSPFQDLRTIRNYLAHRNEITAKRVELVAKNYGFDANLKALDVLTTLRSPGVCLFELWTRQIRIIAFNAVDY